MFRPNRRKLASVSAAIVRGVNLSRLVTVYHRSVYRNVSRRIIASIARVGQLIYVKEEVLGRRRQEIFHDLFGAMFKDDLGEVRGFGPAVQDGYRVGGTLRYVMN